MVKHLGFAVRAIVIESLALAVLLNLPSNAVQVASHRRRGPAPHLEQTAWPARSLLVDFQLTSAVSELRKALTSW